MNYNMSKIKHIVPLKHGSCIKKTHLKYLDNAVDF
jgi:hypothetical protein